ncbi:MAG: hypothetical protein KGQ87_02065 [Verrucomicrobia bacterium]|nr:hypothetical protein [Verrucomicrobiota bacterium]
MKRADHHLVQKVLDGEISREGFDGFQNRLREDPELIQLYGSYASLNHNLNEEFEDGQTDPLATNDRQTVLRAWRIPLAIACVLAIAFAAWILPQLFDGGKNSGDVAIASFSIDAVWRIDGPSKILGGTTALSTDSTLHLLAGRASISLKPSDSLVIEGPTSLRFPSAESIEILKGKCLIQQSGRNNILVVSTPQFAKITSGKCFGIFVDPEQKSDEVHVIDGNLEVLPREEHNTTQLVKGDAVHSVNGAATTRLHQQTRTFANRLDRFNSLAITPFRKSDWRASYGNPNITETRIEGANFAIIHKFQSPLPLDEKSVLLVTLQCAEPSMGKFHSDGWAGMSLFSQGTEMIFLGDPYGPGLSWGLDVKNAEPRAPRKTTTIGSATMTLRYDSSSGSISLHEGGLPLKPAIYSGKIPQGTRFDELRLGASAGAALTVTSLQVRSSGQ